MALLRKCLWEVRALAQGDDSRIVEDWQELGTECEPFLKGSVIHIDQREKRSGHMEPWKANAIQLAATGTDERRYSLQKLMCLK